MLYFSKLKLIVVYFIIIFLSLFSFSNFIENRENLLLSKKVNLGLDLQGGSYLLLEENSDTAVLTFLSVSNMYGWFNKVALF